MQSSCLDQTISKKRCGAGIYCKVSPKELWSARLIGDPRPKNPRRKEYLPSAFCLTAAFL